MDWKARSEPVTNKGVDMKAKHLATSAAVLLCSMAGMAHAQQAQPAAPSAPPSVQQPAMNTAPQSLDQSMGGASMRGTYDSGRGRGRDGQLCIVGLSCDIYKGS
jgi:hypothetical protein